MAYRRCIEPDCNTLTRTTRCPRHQAQRNNRNARGYGTAHQAARAQLLAMLPLPCAYGCGKVLTTPAELIAAHIEDGNPHAGWQPSCRTCNEHAKTRRH